MFYSHEVLTSRKYGVATVWLVATLGPKSGLRKINRKAIQDVDISKACDTITMPEAPMALRLQSSLLYGVSRVYAQQCSYVLVDAQAAQNQMRALLKSIRTSALDPDAGKARPDQLVLQDDPAFLPDLFLPSLDLYLGSLEDSSKGTSHRSSVLSGQSQNSSYSSNKNAEESILGLIIPSSDSGDAAGTAGFALHESDTGAAQPQSFAGGLYDDDGFDPNIGFNFDDEGNLLDLEAGPVARQSETGPAPSRIRSSSAVSARVRQEHEEGRLANQNALGEGMNIDIDIPGLEGYQYDNALPEAEPFTEIQTTGHRDAVRVSSVVHEEESLAFAEAAQRKPRGRRELPADAAPQLRNSDLADWGTYYLANMAEATLQKQQHRLPFQAKKNAAHWVIGSGIGGVGNGLGTSKLPSPLNMFCGIKLLEALTGTQQTIAGHKRSRSEQDDRAEDEGRRSRPRSSEEEQIGRGEAMNLDDNQDLFPAFDDTGIEMGRAADAPLLEDHSSQMPWNQASIQRSRYGSRPGSVSLARASHPHPTSSIGGFPTSAGIPSSLDRRASRLISASPLLGRSSARDTSIELPHHANTNDDDDDDDDDEAMLGGAPHANDPALDDFQLFGPAAGVNTQTAAESQWASAALDRESGNFLDFVRAEIEAARAAGDVGADDEDADEDEAARREGRGSVLFETLLPPGRHTAVVAAQAFHHVLVLATRGLLSVEQDVGFGRIALGVVPGF